MPVGQALVGEIHIVDDDGNELPAGEVGTIYFGGSGAAYSNDLLIHVFGPAEATYDYDLYIQIRGYDGEDECEC